MKHLLIIPLAACILAASTLSAQEKPRFNADQACNTLRAELGILTPDSPDAMFSLSYTRRFSGHWGWRTGFQYASEMASVQDHFGLPVAIVYRSGTYDFDASMQYAARGTASQVIWDGLHGRSAKDISSHALRNFLCFLFRRAEGFAGLTPGYVFGEGTVGRMTTQYGEIREEGIRVDSRFTLSADAGCTLSIPVWRFSLDLTPAVHYLVTNNFCEYHQQIDPEDGSPIGSPVLKPLRWQFSIDFGLSFLF